MAEGICLVAQSLNFVARQGWHKEHEPIECKSILKNVNLVAREGELTAIMGPSGSGKTSLLNIIAGRTRNPVIDTTADVMGIPDEIKNSSAFKKAPVPFGRILLNGSVVGYPALRQTSRYVMQSDCLLPFLTVYETIRFAGQLKLTHLHAAERAERVENVISTLALGTCRNVLIGDQVRKGVSGGQRKRVAIAIELLENPQLLFLDEPTSGLDSSLAFDVMQTVKQLIAKSNTEQPLRKVTVICTIHQPRKQIYDMFDRLVLLSQGEVVYHGPATDISAFWTFVGHATPPRQNVADWSLDILSAPIDPSNESAPRKLGSKAGLRSAFARGSSFLPIDPVGQAASFADDASKGSKGDGIRDDSVIVDENNRPLRCVVTASEIAELPRQFEGTIWGQALQREVKTLANMTDQRPFLEEKPRRVSCSAVPRNLMNICTLAHRFLLNRWRNKNQLVILAGVTFFLTLFTSFTFYQMKMPENEFDCTSFYNFIGFVASMGVSASFCIMQNWIDFPISRPMINRERAGGLYNSWSLLIGMVIGDTPTLLIPSIVSALTAFWIVGFGNNEARYFFFYFLFNFSLSFASTGWVMIAAMIAPSAPSASAIAPIGVIVSLLLSGLWVTDNALPKVWLGIRYLTWIRYGVNALLIYRFGDSGVVAECGTMPLQPGAWGNIGLLYALGLGFRCLAGLALSSLHTRQGLEA